MRQEKNDRVAGKREAAAEAAREARPAPDDFDQLTVLEEVLSNLRGQLVAAPPQSVAGIAKQIRDTASEIAQLTGSSTPSASAAAPASGLDEIAAKYREKRAGIGGGG